MVLVVQTTLKSGKIRLAFLTKDEKWKKLFDQNQCFFGNCWNYREDA
jgi:hypothetical protein